MPKVSCIARGSSSFLCLPFCQAASDFAVANQKAKDAAHVQVPVSTALASKRKRPKTAAPKAAAQGHPSPPRDEAAAVAAGGNASAGASLEGNGDDRQTES